MLEVESRLVWVYILGIFVANCVKERLKEVMGLALNCNYCHTVSVFKASLFRLPTWSFEIVVLEDCKDKQLVIAIKCSKVNY